MTLLLLSPAIGELLSGSSPPEEFFMPLTFLTLVALYGAGALLAREAWVRWGMSPGSLLLLGAAYGVLEEGVVTRSFFCPTWPDLDVLAVYGRWAGVNWVWTVELTVFHAVFSVAIPVGIVELLYPDARGRPWLGRRGVVLATASLAGITTLWLIGFRCEVPVSAGLVILALLAAVFLTLLARRGAKTYVPGRLPPPHFIKAIAVGAAWALFTILGPFVMAHTPVPAALACAVELSAIWWYVRWALKRRWSPDVRAFDLACGPLWGLWVIALLQAFSVPSMFLVVAAFTPILWLMRRIVRRSQSLWPLQGVGADVKMIAAS